MTGVEEYKLVCFQIHFPPAMRWWQGCLYPVSRVAIGVWCRIYTFGLVIAFRRWSSPSSRVLNYFACCEGFAFAYWNIGERVLQRNGRYQIFWYFRCHLFQWKQRCSFFRDIIWANPIAGVWLGYLHIFQQVSYSQ